MASENESDSRRKVRSPAYPAISLPKAVEYVEAFYQKEHQHAAAPAVAAKALGFSDHTTGPAGSALAALKYFGLLEHDDKKNMRVTQTALDIILSPSADHPPRVKAIRDAALTPAIYQELWAKWEGRLPSDQNIAYYLERERKFNPKVISGIIKDFRATLEFAKVGVASPTLPEEHSADPPKDSNDHKKRRTMHPGTKEDNYTLKHGEVVLQWPDRIPSDEYEDLEAWLQLMIRKVKRSVSDEPPGDTE